MNSRLLNVTPWSPSDHRSGRPGIWRTALISIGAGVLLALPALALAGQWVVDDATGTAMQLPGPANARTGPGTNGMMVPSALTWSGDPTVNLQVSGSTQNGFNSAMAPDGLGGMIVVWEDDRDFGTTGYDLYAQHVLKCGDIDPTWPSSGLAVTRAPGWDEWPILISDGSGGAIVAWTARHDTVDPDIFAQHVLSTGTLDPAWPANGAPVCNAAGREQIAKITTDGAHGAFLTWDDRRGGTRRVFVQHVLSSGVDPGWPVNGADICPSVHFNQTIPAICSDGTGGAIVAWGDARDLAALGRRDIYAQRITATGALQWSPGGQLCCAATGLRTLNGAGAQFFNIACSADGQGGALVPDAAGGCFVAWSDYRDPSTITHVYAQHLNASGGVVAGWNADGVLLCSAPGPQSFAQLIADGAGGVIASWVESDVNSAGNQNFGRPGVFAQHVSAAGFTDGPPSGLVMSAAGGNFTFTAPFGVSDGAGGAIYLWNDPRDFGLTGWDAYAQHVRVSPAPMVDPAWPVDGAPVSVSPGDQLFQLGGGQLSDGAAGALAAWDDNRIGFLATFAQRVFASGSLGPPAVTATAGSHGAINPSGVQAVVCGSSLTFTFAPDAGYHVSAVTVDGGPAPIGPGYTFPSVSDNHTINVQFAINTYALSVSTAGTGTGTVGKAPDLALYDHGSVVILTASAGVGSMFTGWSGDASGSTNPLTVTMDRAKNITATFTLNTYALNVTTAGTGSGTVGKAPDRAVYDYGSTVLLSATPALNSTFTGWSGDLGGTANPLALVMNGDKNVVANFALRTFSILATAGPHGSILPHGTVTVPYGQDQAFLFQSDPCYSIATLVVDGQPVAPALSYTFTGVTADHTISVTFAANPAPTATITGPASGAAFPINSPVSFTGSFADNAGDTHTAQWTFDALSVVGAVNEGAGTVGASYTFTTPGVYTVKLTVTDQCGGAGTATQVGGFDAMVVVYDPSAGFVTGGGWINSPPGAYTANPSLTGTANFGFVSKYQKGAAIPTGETEFQFKVAALDFHSTSYDWLVVSGAKAQYKGSGTINGAGDYAFLLTATDGGLLSGDTPDKLRMKITNKTTSAVVYDNQLGASDGSDPTTALGGGSIVIRGSMTGRSLPQLAPTALLEYGLAEVRPNPFSAQAEISYSLRERSLVSIELYDLAGRRLQTLVGADQEAGLHSVSVSRTNLEGGPLSAGVYFVRMSARSVTAGASFLATRKLIVLN